MVLRLAGSVRLEREVQRAKARKPMVKRLSGSVRLVRDWLSEKALTPMVVRLVGSVRLVREVGGAASNVQVTLKHPPPYASAQQNRKRSEV
jgi:hypothetical protein